MKRFLVFSYLVMVIFLNLTSKKVFCREMRETHMDTLYKQIGEQLVGIKKEYPPSQSKIYIVLDQVDKMYNMAKIKAQHNDQLKETLKTKELENNALQNELVTLKTTLDSTQAKLDVTTHNLDQEKKLVAKLAEEKKEALSKEQKIDATQTNLASDVGQKQAMSELANLKLR